MNEMLPVPAEDLPAGYRMTELGPLPEDWQVVRLGEVAYLKQGRTPSREMYDDTKGYRCIKVKDFDDGGLVSILPKGERSFTLTDLGPAVRVQANDILILNAGHSTQVVGQKVGLVPRELEGCFFVAELTAVRSLRAEAYFLFCVMLLSRIREAIQRKVKGGHLYASQLKTIPIPLPPLPEQQEIARILQAVDEKIRAEEAYKQALEGLFRSLLHHLMTAQLRLPQQFVQQFAGGDHAAV